MDKIIKSLMNNHWDQNYLYEVMLFKLVKMHEYLSGSQSLCVHSDKKLRKMKVCIHILQRKVDYAYEDLHHFSLRSEGGVLDIYISKSSRRLFLKDCQRVSQIEVDEWELFCKLFFKHSEHWWD